MAIALVTANELLSHPSGIDWNTVAQNSGFNDPAQAMEQSRLIEESSFAIANVCGQPLGLHATQLTEVASARDTGWFGSKAHFDKDQHLVFNADTLPVVSVVSGEWSGARIAPMNWTPINPGDVSSPNYIIGGSYPQQRQVTFFDQDYRAARTVSPIVIKVTYVSGWANAVLKSPVIAGTNVTLTVDDTTGMNPGQVLTIYDGAQSETVQVLSVLSATEAVVYSLILDHAENVGVSTVPPDIKLACKEYCAGLARIRGQEVFQMTQSPTSKQGNGSAVATQSNIVFATQLLVPYRVMW